MNYSDRYWDIAVTINDLFCDCYGNEYDGLKRKKDIVAAFRNMLKYIILDLINLGIGFKFPNSTSMLTFLQIDESKVKLLKNRGWVQKLDVFDSNFLSYRLYYYNGKRLKIPIHFSGDVNDVLFDKINSGANLSTYKLKTLSDYLPIFYKMYPFVPKKDIKRLIEIGFSRMIYCLNRGAAFSISSHKFKTHFGNIPWNKFKRELQFKKTLMLRERCRYKWNSELYSGYYYIAISRPRLKEFANLNIKSKYWVHFGTNVAYKVLDELRWYDRFSYIFRIPMEERKNYMIRLNEPYKNPEIIGIFEKGQFREDHTYWKKIVKQTLADNETGK